MSQEDYPIASTTTNTTVTTTTTTTTPTVTTTPTTTVVTAGPRRVKNGNYQNAVIALSYEDEKGEIFFLVGQPAKPVKVFNSNTKTMSFHPTLQLWPFGFSGGQVDKEDEMIAREKGYKKDKGLPKMEVINSINQYAAVRELKEETGIDIEMLAKFLDIKLEKINKEESTKITNNNQTHYYHVHLGPLGKETLAALVEIISLHMNNGRGDDLKNVKFIDAKKLDEDSKNQEKSKYVGTVFEKKAVVIETQPGVFEDFFNENVKTMQEINKKFFQTSKNNTENKEDKITLIDQLLAHVLKCHYLNHEDKKIPTLLKLISFLQDKSYFLGFVEENLNVFKENSLKIIWGTFQAKELEEVKTALNKFKLLSDVESTFYPPENGSPRYQFSFKDKKSAETFSGFMFKNYCIGGKNDNVGKSKFVINENHLIFTRPQFELLKCNLSSELNKFNWKDKLLPEEINKITKHINDLEKKQSEDLIKSSARQEKINAFKHLLMLKDYCPRSIAIAYIEAEYPNILLKKINFGFGGVKKTKEAEILANIKNRVFQAEALKMEDKKEVSSSSMG